MVTKKSRAALRSTLLVAIVIVCIAFLDRPIATWCHTQFYGSHSYAAADAMFRALDRVLPFGGALLVAALVWQRWKSISPPWLHRLVTAGVVAAIALGITLALKFAMGRSQIYPTFLRQHIYTFHPLSTSPDYGSFPSATMSGVSAFVTGLGLPRGATRIVLTGAILVLTVALLVTNGHWLSDIVAGTYLGVLIGRLSYRRRTPGADAVAEHFSEPRRP